MKLESQFIDIKLNGGPCDSYLTFPGVGGPFPAVILFMDGYGPRAYLYEMAQKFAAQGYFVLLPNLMYRARRAPVIDTKFPITAENQTQARDQLMPLFQKYVPEEAVQDTALLLDFLAKQKQVRPGKVGVTGYCMGGGLALRVAARYPDKIGGAGSFHGGNLANDQPDSPDKLLTKIKAEIYVAHADNDSSMPPEQIERFEKAAKEARQLKYEIETYKGALHGFTMLDLPNGNAQALARHWDKILPLFKRTLA